jgi:hypothetical protein
MRVPTRKWRGFLSLLTLTWLSFGLCASLHFHRDFLDSQAPDHCVVCHALPQIKSDKGFSSFRLPLPDQHIEKLFLSGVRPEGTVPLPNVRSRSPPLA